MAQAASGLSVSRCSRFQPANFLSPSPEPKMSGAALLRRALARGTMTPLAHGASAPKPQPSIARSFATKSASPETPLLHYTATQQATSSINHRIFYVNVAFLVFVVDAGSAMLDV
mmetsp:Transcript_14840/g.22209  ORF Transcript_14840/g.22209 Transcript_14840/m.22209 type:complete len:115 (+) Transcript_14840:3-347(+)